jgi:putative endonuclease
MFAVYFLRSKKDGNLYIGHTRNLKVRLLQHVLGQVQSTKYRRPLILLGWRRFGTLYDAIKWEGKYKNSHGQLERDIGNLKITLFKKQSLAQ